MNTQKLVKSVVLHTTDVLSAVGQRAVHHHITTIHDSSTLFRMLAPPTAISNLPICSTPLLLPSDPPYFPLEAAYLSSPSALDPQKQAEGRRNGSSRTTHSHRNLWSLALKLLRRSLSRLMRRMLVLMTVVVARRRFGRGRGSLCDFFGDARGGFVFTGHDGHGCV